MSSVSGVEQSDITMIAQDSAPSTARLRLTQPWHHRYVHQRINASTPRQRGGTVMADLSEFAAQLLRGDIEVIDLTAPLHAGTPILQLPPPWGQTRPFQLEEISRYDDRGPAWYWNNIRTGEHTGTHLDAPNHWVTGKDREDVSQIPPHKLIGPAVVIDKVSEATA